MQTIDIKEVKQEVVDKMEQYKQEFIEFMVESLSLIHISEPTRH